MEIFNLRQAPIHISFASVLVQNDTGETHYTAPQQSFYSFVVVGNKENVLKFLDSLDFELLKFKKSFS